MIPRLQKNERLDDLMRYGRKIIQNTDEFCFSIDAVLLAHYPKLHKKENVIDLGTGTGVMPLIMADDVSHIEAVELSPVMYDLARRNVEMNDLTGKINVVEGDYRHIRDMYEPESFDLVISNPPYRPVGNGDVNRLSGIAKARHEFTATLSDVIDAAAWCTRYHGHFAMVHIPERLGEIFYAMHEVGFAVKRLRMVAPRASKDPNIVLLDAVKGAAEGLKVEPELVVHEPDGSYTYEIKKIYGLIC